MGFIRGAKVLDAPAQARRRRDAPRAASAFARCSRWCSRTASSTPTSIPATSSSTSDGKVIILDLGLTAELDEAARRAFALFFASWAGGNGKTMAKLMSELSPSSKVADYAAYEREVDEFVGRYHGKALGEVQVSTVAFDMFNILRRHRVRVNPVYTMCNVAIAVTEGIGKQLDPRLDLVQEALPFFVTLRQAGRL